LHWQCQAVGDGEEIIEANKNRGFLATAVIGESAMFRYRNVRMRLEGSDDAKSQHATAIPKAGAKKDGKAPLAPSQTLPSNLSVAPQHEQVTTTLCQFPWVSKKKCEVVDKKF